MIIKKFYKKQNTIKPSRMRFKELLTSYIQTPQNRKRIPTQLVQGIPITVLPYEQSRYNNHLTFQPTSTTLNLYFYDHFYIELMMEINLNLFLHHLQKHLLSSLIPKVIQHFL